MTSQEPPEAVSGPAAVEASPQKERVRGVRVFSSVAGAARTRRPTDVIMLVVAFLILLALWWPAPGPTTIDTDLTNLLRHLDGGVWTLLWDLSYAVLAIWPIALVLIVVVSRGRRRILLDLLLAALVASGLAFLISDLAGTPFSVSFQSLTSANSPQVYLAVRLAIATAIVVTASPHLSRPMRLVGRAALLLGAISVVALGVAYPVGVAAGFAVGLVAAAVAHLVFGSPGGELSPSQVADAVGELGLIVHDVQRSRVQTPGVQIMVAQGEHNERLLIKIFGRDAWDSQFLGSLWTAVVRRGERPTLGRSRQGQLDHEAVATLVAERAVVPVWSEVKVGSSADGDAILVSEVGGRRLSLLAADEIDDELLRNAWRALVKLHDAGISHGRIDNDRVLATNGSDVALADFAQANLVATDDATLTDRARLLVTTATAAGDDRAVAAAVTVLGPQGLADVLPYLQPAVLDSATRRAVKDQEWDLKALRTSAASAAGVDPPPLQKLQRVTWKSLAIAVVGALLGYALISRLLGVDFAAIVTELGSANWWWVTAALLVSPTTQAAYAIGTVGAASKPVRYVPVVMLEYAIQFLAVTVPSAAAKYALDVRFFQKFGLPTAAALSIGVIDSTAGFVVQIFLIALIALTALPGLTEPLTGASSSSGSTSTGSSLLHIAWWLLAILVAAAVVSWLIPATRRRIKAAVPKLWASLKEQAASASSALAVLRRPKKLAQMAGGNLLAQVIQGVVLGLCLAAFGHDAHLSQLVLINTLVSLFAGFMPVPGGVGVAEAGYTACLQAIGIPSAVAISTAILFRLVTFYLPPPVVCGGHGLVEAPSICMTLRWQCTVCDRDGQSVLSDSIC